MAEMELGRVVLDVGTSNVAYFISTAVREPDLELNSSFDHSRTYSQDKAICPLSTGPDNSPSHSALKNIYLAPCKNVATH